MWAPRRALVRYRRAGADPPYFDPSPDHAAPFEGYYWRFSDPAHGRVVIALCGLCRLPGRRWAVVALAAHPGNRVHDVVAEPADANSDSFGVRAGQVVAASDRAVRFDLGAATLGAELIPTSTWPRRRWGGTGVGQLLPGLPQYWHPWLLGGAVRGEATIDGERIPLDGAHVYAEKNWGRAFPERWWWGQADTFDAGDACMAFAGGPLRVAGLGLTPTLVAIRIGERLISLTPPLARTAASVGADSWRLRTRAPGYAVEIEGEGRGSSVRLPVPVRDRVAVAPRSTQALAGWLRVAVRRRRRTLFRGESELAGLERESES
jgi:tocopherol cyclase